MNIEQKTIQIKDIAVALDLDYDYLSSRPDGEKFATYLRKEFEGMIEPIVILLDFSDVELMDGSFADEVFGTIASARSRKELELPVFVLCNVDSVSLDNLELALISRPAREKGIRNCVIPVKKVDETLVLCGKYEGHVRQTFELLNDRIHLTTNDVSQKLELGITAASTRLKVLHTLGLAVRIEKRDELGRQYIYRSIR